MRDPCASFCVKVQQVLCFGGIISPNLQYESHPLLKLMGSFEISASFEWGILHRVMVSLSNQIAVQYPTLRSILGCF